VAGSPFAIAATEESPAALVRVTENGEPTELLVGKRVSELSASPTASGQSRPGGGAAEPIPVGPQAADPAAALNGAQVASVLDILAKVSEGSLEKDAAVALIASAFPTVSMELAGQIVDGAVPPGEDE